MNRVVSLYSGAGGLDLGFKREEFSIIWANDFDQDACKTYELNIGNHIKHGDIHSYIPEIQKIRQKVDVLIGGPPCQGFSVAGKMDPQDERSKNVWTFTKILDILKPKAFLMENVKALGSLHKWSPLRDALLQKMRNSGYSVNYIILNAADFSVPQARERVFFIGFKANPFIVPNLQEMLLPYRKEARTVRETLSILDRVGTGNNTSVCNAKITIAPKPVLRKSPFAGMLFNGLGRPIRLDGYSATLPASMGGNKTPIIDNDELYLGKKGWVETYHKKLRDGKVTPHEVKIPTRLRRLTLEEAALLQTFPLDYSFYGSQSSKFKQIGNAVPCGLARQLALLFKDYLATTNIEKKIIPLN
ncbi:MAG: DNA cytosine methyltransferase [Spirochaetota bacterium]